MLARGPSQPENRPRETLTQRLNRLRLEHRRNLRNSASSSSQPRTRAFVTAGPSLPDGNIPLGPNHVDTWNEDGAASNIRPRPGQPANQNPGLAANRPPDRAPVHGPPPPRSWVNISARNTAAAAPRRSSTRLQPRKPTGTKNTRRAAPGISLTERRRLKEEDLVQKIYGDACWFREAENAKWAAWREEALRLVFSYVVGSLDAGRQLLHENAFNPFKTEDTNSAVPTLFETALKFIFPSPSHGRSGDKAHHEDEDMDPAEILPYLPAHIQKRALRFAAAHRPLKEDQLQRIYEAIDSESNEVDDIHPEGKGQLSEIVLSGRGLQAAAFERLLVEIKKRESGDSTRQPDLAATSLQSIILFQTPYLQKRHLNTFPKTLTTLGLIALPPPKELLEHGTQSHAVSGSSTAAEVSATLGCFCPWCATAEHATPGPSQNITSSVPSLPLNPLTPVPYTSSALVPQLIDLPTLLPSLVILDVSYNPWMTAGDILRITNPSPKGMLCKRKPEPPDQGIFAHWDVRLWGRMKVLGVRGCFERVHVDDYMDEDQFLTDAVHLMRVGSPSFTGSTQHCGCGVPPGSPAEWWKRDALFEKWEKTMYAVGRSFEVIWREHGCRCSPTG